MAQASSASKHCARVQHPLTEGNDGKQRGDGQCRCHFASASCRWFQEKLAAADEPELDPTMVRDVLGGGKASSPTGIVQGVSVSFCIGQRRLEPLFQTCWGLVCPADARKV